MTDKKISAESAASALDGTEEVLVVQSAANARTTTQDIADLGGGGAPGGSDTQVQFNDSAAFGGSAKMVFNKTSGAFTLNPNTGNAVILSVKNSAIGGTPGFEYRAVDGTSTFTILQGGSGGGMQFNDFNGQPLFGLGTNAGGFGQVTGWSIQGTNNTALFDLGPGVDNSYNIGDATHNVKTIHHYTSKLKPVAIGSLPGSPVAGMLAAVNDALTPIAGATVSAGGAAFALVCYNGAAWKVVVV